MVYSECGNITDQNLSEGLDVVFNYANCVSGSWFGTLLLVAVYIIVGTGYYKYQKDGAGALGMAGFFTFVIALLFKMADFISSSVFYIAFGVAIVSVVWLILSKK